MRRHRLDTIASSAVTAALAAVAASCSDGATDFEPILSVMGFVSLAGTPQQGIRVELSSPIGSGVAFTDGNGLYRISGMPNGEYQVTPVKAGETFRPASRVLTVDNADVIHMSFVMKGGTPHAITGHTSDIAGVKVTLAGDDPGAVLSQAGGAFTIPAVRLGSFTITPTKAGVTFTPASAEILGVIDFTHHASGALGNATLVSVTYDNGVSSAAPFFAAPANAPEGVGSLRPRRPSELSPADSAAFEALWQSAKTVTFLYNSTQGNQAIVIQLLPDHTWTATAADFGLAERLVNGTGLTFSATMP